MTLDEWNIECQRHLVAEVDSIDRALSTKNINYLDIGANVGVLYDLLKLKNYTVGKFIMIEPNPTLYSYLTKKFQNIDCIILNVAVTDENEDGKSKFYIDPTEDNFGLHHLGEYGTETVNTVSFSKFLDTNKEFMKSVDLVKIDTENYDFLLMKVLYKFLLDNNIKPVVAFENNWNRKLSKEQAREIYNLFINTLEYTGPKFDKITGDIVIH